MRFFPIPSIPMALLLALVLASLLMTAALAGCGGGDDPAAPVAPSSDEATPSSPVSGSPAPRAVHSAADCGLRPGHPLSGRRFPLALALPSLPPWNRRAPPPGLLPRLNPPCRLRCLRRRFLPLSSRRPFPVDRGSLETDREALIAIFNALDGRFWELGFTTTWATDAPLDQWPGVSVEEGRVVSLELEGERLKGELSPEVGNLSKLTHFFITESGLTGEIPPELGQLSELRTLRMRSNELGGEIPPELGNLSNLVVLALSGNDLTGKIPPELGNLSKLAGLSLGDNRLSGGVPSELDNIPGLVTLNLANNPLTGSVPVELMDRVERFSLSGTQLSTPDREALAALYHATGGPNWTSNDGWLSDRPLGEWQGVVAENERVVELKVGGLVGELPPELGGLTSLRVLWLWDNELTGRIPPELGGLTSMEDLWLMDNRLTGEVPPELGNLSNLWRLILAGNQLTGELPRELADLPRLRDLNLSNNRLTGEIPPEFGNFTNLEGLGLGGNELSGEIPRELGLNQSLKYLGLGRKPSERRDSGGVGISVLSGASVPGGRTI